MVLCPPDLALQHLPGVIQGSEADAVVRDAGAASEAEIGLPLAITACAELSAPVAPRRRTHATEWILLTSGTTGAPKLVLHTLESLTSALTGEAAPAETPIWSTFYDIRRYGGLQIFLRGVHAGSLVLSRFRRGRRGLPGARRGGGCDAHLRHPLALAQGAHERCHGTHRAALRAPLGRNRRPGGARWPACGVSGGDRGARVRVQRSRGCLRSTRRSGRISRSRWWAKAARAPSCAWSRRPCRSARPVPRSATSERARNRCAARMASWIPGIASRRVPGAITSWAVAAGSSTSGASRCTRKRWRRSSTRTPGCACHSSRRAAIPSPGRS